MPKGMEPMLAQIGSGDPPKTQWPVMRVKGTVRARRDHRRRQASHGFP